MNCIYLKAPNDVNGNPRRLYVFVDGDTPVVIDEGYEGRRASWNPILTIEISPSEYKRLRKTFNP